MSIYQHLYNIVHQYIYGGVTLTSDMSLVCTLVSTFACILCIALPFIAIWGIIKNIMRY